MDGFFQADFNALLKEAIENTVQEELAERTNITLYPRDKARAEEIAAIMERRFPQHAPNLSKLTHIIRFSLSLTLSFLRLLDRVAEACQWVTH